jgi:branched-chain amino acid transport system substrate-binding protein
VRIQAPFITVQKGLFMQKSRYLGVVAVVAAAALSITACSSSKNNNSTGTGTTGGTTGSASGSASGGGGNGSPIKVGVVADLTGVASSTFSTSEKGIKAYADGVNAQGGVNGHKIEYVMADTTSTPAGALSAAQKLVQQDKVFAIISDSASFFGAEAYLLKQKVPVLGTAFDGPEWQDPKNTNLFVAAANVSQSTVYADAGLTAKKLGATTCGSLGYSSSPSSTASLKSFQKSCAAAGLKDGYSTGVAFGSTDVAPVALAMKNAGVDYAYMSTVTNTGFAFAAAAKQAGANIKLLFPTGYGGDLLKVPAAVQAAQGFYFTVTFQPVEMQTDATKLLQQRLEAAGEKSAPGYAEQVAYLSMSALARGIKAAGDNPTPESFTTGLRAVTDFDADGLLSPVKVSFSDYDPPQRCQWIVQLQGTKFNLINGLEPSCGNKIS